MPPQGQTSRNGLKQLLAKWLAKKNDRYVYSPKVTQALVLDPGFNICVDSAEEEKGRKKKNFH